MAIGAPSSFFRVAVIYAILGMALGLHMAMSQNHTQFVTHAHLLLIGWVTTFLYGAFLKLHPAAVGMLSKVLWGVANIGVIVTIIGLFIVYGGDPVGGEPFAAGGSMTVFAGMILFAVIVWRTKG